MANFKNRLHEQLARRTARNAFREADPDADEVTVWCDVTNLSFKSADEGDLRSQLEAHYKSAEYRRATNITIEKQRALRDQRWPVLFSRRLPCPLDGNGRYDNGARRTQGPRHI